MEMDGWSIKLLELGAEYTGRKRGPWDILDG